MKSYVLTSAVCLSLAVPVYAQDEESGGFISKKLEESLSGDGRIVKIIGFEGALSSTATMDKLTVADSDGVWLILEGATMNWKRAALLRGNVEVEEMSADRIEILRKPIAAPSAAPTAEAKEFALPNLPVSINIAKVSVPEVSLGEDILGMPLEISLEASAQLADGSGQATFAASRVDNAVGNFAFSGGFAAETQVLDIELDFKEAADGIVAQLMKIPDTPALEASIVGHGPLADFVADFFLASDGEKRIEGSVELLQEPFVAPVVSDQTAENAEDEAPADDGKTQVFKLDMGGDVTALFAQEYRSFFGTDLQLKLDGQRTPDGAVDLDSFSLKAETVDLAGSARLSADAWPTLLDIQGEVKSADGTPVLLPLSGAATRVDNVKLELAYDAEKGSGWTGIFDVKGLVQEGIELAAAQLNVTGNIDTTNQEVKGLTADLVFDTKGFLFDDPALSEAIGDSHTGRAHVEYTPNTPLVVHDVSLEGKGLSLRGDFDIGSPAKGLPMTFKAALTAQDISQFAAIAQRPLKGGANVSISGSATPLSGMFDVKVQGETQDLAIGIEQVDPLLAGVSQIFVDAVRDATGATVRDFKVTTPEVTAVAHAKASGDSVTFDYDATLRDLAVILPQYPGAVQAKGEARQTDAGIVLDTTLTAPLDTMATVSGLVTGPNAAVTFEAKLGNFGAIVAALPGSIALNGALEKQGADWHVNTNLEGSMGISAKAEGLILENMDLDMALSGQAPLGLAAPFIVPRTISGNAQFDLAINGAASLNALSGQIAVTNTNVSAPALKLALNDIGAQVTLKDSFANIDVTAQVSSGGALAVNGGISLVGAYDGQIAIDLQSIKLEDPTLFTTSLDGKVTINGPLLGGALIAGNIDIGETEIKVPAGIVATSTAIPPMEHVSASASVRQTLDRAGLLTEAKDGPPNTQVGGPEYGLDLTISAPNKVFVRGRGIDAEMGGDLKLSGTTKNLVSTGGLKLTRGRIRVLEKRFDLTDGEILMEGSLDPRLNLIATTPIPDGEASILIGGFVSDPEVTFVSDPEAPQDQVLALIFFGENIEDLSPFQTLQLASAVASLAGKGGIGVVSKLRDSLPVDDLELDSDDDGNATVRVGKRLTENVYSGFAVNSEGETELSLNLDITKKLTATGTTSSDGSSAIGLFFNTDY